MMERDELRSRMRVRRHVAGGGVYPKAGSLGTSGHAASLRHVFVAMLLGMVFMLAPVQRAYANPIEDLGNAVAQFFGIGEEAAPAAATANTTVDPATIGGWRDWMGTDGQLTTNNVGRVWTDKSVYNDDVTLQSTGDGITIKKGDDADFLVALSALSSYSNLSTTSTRPLDIVLMLDMSGSMTDPITTYNETYDINTGNTYYVLDNGEYHAVTYRDVSGIFEPERMAWAYNAGSIFPVWREFVPKESATDQTAGRVQFYTRGSSQRKIAALRTAVEGFINKTAEANGNISDPARQHHLSIAKFASENTSEAVGSSTDRNGYQLTQRVTALQAVTADNKQTVIDAMKKVNPVGPTAAHSGMTLAKNILAGIMDGDSPRDDAQKVVIFFTDGEPTDNGSSFNGTVANGAIGTARTMKQSGTMVYSIGVFTGADPSNTSNNFNAYMNGVSSNYPNATFYNNLGTRVDAEKNYYYAAENAGQLNEIFENIFTEIESSTTGSPTEVGSGDPTKGGYITFTDQLGSYMQVENFRSVLFNGAQYGLKKGIDQPTDDGNGNLSYVFEGIVNDNDLDSPYPEVDMEDIVITVKRSTDVSVGDVVTVKIPAANIPISKYKVTQNAEGEWTGEHKQAYPMVVFYGVKLKPEAVKLIADPDAAMQSYIASHSNGDKVSFYSNAYDEGRADGLTSASFMPSMTNNFNRFAEDTPLFKDEKCTHPVSRDEFSPQDTTYYYQRTEYLFPKDDGAAKPNTFTRELKPGSDSVLTAANGAYVGEDADGNMYIKAESPRIQRLNTDIAANKANNATDTATTSNTPYWEQGVDGTYDTISIYLGNNGKLDVDIPGTLSVTKNATIADGSVGPVDQDGNSTLSDQEFKLTVTAAFVAGKTFDARVMDAEGHEVSKPDMTVTFDGNGTYTQTLKNGEALQIMGLPAGTAYTVAETGDMPAGFNLKSVDSVESKTTSTGTIAAGQTSYAVFHNEYKAVATDAVAPFKAQKIFNSWGNVSEAAQFDIRLAAIEWPGMDQGVDPTFPKNAEVEQGTAFKYVSHLVKKTDQDKEAEFSFGDITFDRAGTYIYRIGEFVPENPTAGVQYSNTIYRVTVAVTDNGAGQLSATYKMIDESQQGQPEVSNGVAKITNAYDLAEAQVALQARKQYTDNSGANPLTANKFTFAIEPLSANAPVPQYQDEKGNWQEYEKLDGSQDIYKATNFLDRTIALGTLRFDESTIVNGQPTEYVYKLWEVVGSEKGMTYDPNDYYAHVTVEKSGNAVVGKVVYTNSEQSGGESITDLVFSNTYTPAFASLSGDSAIKGTKTLTGRDMRDAELFGFTLTPDTATQAAIDAGTITFDKDALNAAVQDAKNGQAASFSFGDLTFNKAGTYTFSMAESSWSGRPLPQNGTDGMTFDRHTCTVTVTVKLDAITGTLSATAAYSTAGTGSAFHNTYAAQATSPSVTVGKTLTGRNMNPGDFSFKIEAVDDAPAPSPQDAAFSNKQITPDGQTEYMTGLLDNIRFDQDDAGKTFDYRVTEVKPKDADDADGNADNGFQYQGVTYDENVYTVRFTPVDNADGTMTVGVEVLNAEGSSLNKTGLVSFKNTYVATGKLEGATSLAGTKAISGDMPDKDLSGFNFKLEQVDSTGNPVTDNTVTLPANATSVTSDAKGKFEFGDIAFTRPGTYHFQVSEIIPSEGDRILGLTYDTKIVRFRVTVTDNGDGTLNVAKAAGAQEIAFTNVYKPTPTASVPVVVNKKVVGADAKDGQFTFKLVSGDDATADAVAAGAVTVEGETLGEDCLVATSGEIKDGATQENISFGDFTFHKAGTYKFKITEDVPRDVPAGWTYDKHPYTITFEVTDNDAQLTASPSADVSNLFVNTYEAGSIALDTNALFSKTITGRNWLESDSFTFTLTPDDNAFPMPKDAEGKPVSTVTVSSKGTAAGTKVPFGFGTIEFTDADMADATENEDGSISKTFTYQVTENAYDIAGMAPEVKDQVAKLSITITDKGTGQLVVTAQPVTDPDFVNVYTSGSVDVDAHVGGGVQVVKTLTGREIKAGDFTFVMTPVNDEAKAKFGDAKSKTVPTTAAQLGVSEAANTAVATTIFPTGLEFNLEDAGKTFSFEVAERQDDKPGYSYDKTEHALNFMVADSDAGTLSVDVNLDGTTVATWSDSIATVADNVPVTIEFTNAYGDDAEATANIAGSKTLTGRPQIEGEFAFVLSNGAAEVARATNGADGTIAFPAINYTLAKLNADAASGAAARGTNDAGQTTFTYAYTVAEDTTNLPEGVTEVTVGSQAVKAVVTDDGSGKLSAEVTYPDNGLVFENAYGAGEDGTAKLALNGVKNLTAEQGLNVPDITGRYTFTLEAVTPGAPMPQKTTANNDQTGNFCFDPINFDMSVFDEPAAGTDAAEGDEDIDVAATSPVRTKRFEYRVTESGSVAGVVNDPDIDRKVAIVVTDHGNGAISAVVDGTASESNIFTNTYKVTPEDSSLTGEGNFTITKTLDGRAMNAGEFQFVLVTADGTRVAEGSNDANGNVELDAVKFSKPGEYSYVLSEVKGEVGGVDYDTTTYDVTAKVVDNGDGTLDVTWKVAGLEETGAVTFANTYEAAPTSIVLKASKALTGRALKEGEFEFVLSENGKQIDSAVNDARGGVTFESISYDKVGKHVYTITEVKGDAEGVTYDESAYTITVNVVDDGKGSLVPEWAYGPEGAPVFHNTYKKPAAPVDPAPVDPKPEGPKPSDGLPGTGDGMIAVVAAMAGAGLISMAVGAHLNKRKKHHG